MKSIVCVALFAYLAFTGPGLAAQDTLPEFTVKNRFGKIILSWVNAYPVIKQISIQRSIDSLKGYKTILTVPDPTSLTNGFLDIKAPDLQSYYKLYILLDNGKYLFSKARKPLVDSSIEKPVVQVRKETKSAEPKNEIVAPPQPEAEVTRKFDLATTNSNSRKRSDGLKPDTMKAVPPKEEFVPSSLVYANPDGNITIAIPDSKRKSYIIKFFEDDGTPLFEMDKIKESIMILDKVNFMHSGWFRFEVFENGKLKEKHKFFIPKDPASR